MTTFTREQYDFSVQKNLTDDTEPDLGVDKDGRLRLPTPGGSGSTPGTVKGIPFTGKDGTTYYLLVSTVDPD